MANQKPGGKGKGLAKKKEQPKDLTLYDYGDSAGDGFQQQSGDDIAVPFISVLQSNSPEVDQSDDRYVEGAQAGMLMNTVSKQLYDGQTGITLVPVITDHVYCEFVPRDNGGGYKGRHAVDSDLVKACKADGDSFGKLKTDEGTELIETFEIVCLLLNPNNPDETNEMAIIPFTSTKIKHYKEIMYRLRMCRVGDHTPPMYAHRLRMTTWGDKNPKGKFSNVKLKGLVNDDLVESLVPAKLGDDTHPLLDAGRTLIKQYREGIIRAATETLSQATTSSEDAGDDAGGAFA